MSEPTETHDTSVYIAYRVLPDGRIIGVLPLVQCLRPTQEMVYGVKYRGWSHKRYETVYRALLRSRWPDVRAWLDTLRPDVDVTLLCYCRPGVYCHRHLIARMLARHRPDIPLDVR